MAKLLSLYPTAVVRRDEMRSSTANLADVLADKGVALGDGGYWNMMWGANPAGYGASSSLGTDPIEQLWFVDPAVGLWGTWREVVEGAVLPGNRWRDTL